MGDGAERKEQPCEFICHKECWSGGALECCQESARSRLFTGPTGPSRIGSVLWAGAPAPAPPTPRTTHNDAGAGLSRRSASRSGKLPPTRTPAACCGRDHALRQCWRKVSGPSTPTLQYSAWLPYRMPHYPTFRPPILGAISKAWKTERRTFPSLGKNMVSFFQGLENSLGRDGA